MPQVEKGSSPPKLGSVACDLNRKFEAAMLELAAVGRKMGIQQESNEIPVVRRRSFSFEREQRQSRRDSLVTPEE